MLQQVAHWRRVDLQLRGGRKSCVGLHAEVGGGGAMYPGAQGERGAAIGRHSANQEIQQPIADLWIGNGFRIQRRTVGHVFEPSG